MKVAVVTGANKGIGLGVVRALCHQFSGDVFLTARDEARGQVSRITVTMPCTVRWWRRRR